MKNTNELKVEKGFFEVEGIEKVFEGIHIGERYSYGVVPYFTKDVSLDIISKCEHTLTVKFNNDLDLFEESFEEDGEILTNYSPKVQVFGINYYHVGNGWSWIVSEYDELIKVYRDGTILKAIKQSDFDRYVFITYLNDEIVGLNFHQGVEEIDPDFFVSCPHLTEIYKRLIKHKSIVNDLNQDETISKAIRLYVDAFILQN
jgi:hypothetical protein